MGGLNPSNLFVGAIIYTQKRNPELKARLMFPYETMAKAIRDARKRLRPEPDPTTETETTTSLQ